jgi:hypothetical protein
MTRRIAIAAVLSACFVVLCIVSSVAAQPTADAVAQRAIDVLAGPAWNDARYFAFTFDVEREGKIVASYAQRWDRFTGDYRVSGKNREGEDVLVVMNINTKEGKAWKNGQAVADPKDLLTFGYRRFINDTYWLLAPWKVFDPGVQRTYDGEKPGPDGFVCDVIKLSFDGVGLTPKDIYWLSVTRDGHQMLQWQYVLGGAAEEPTTAVWKDWRTFGGIRLSVEKVFPGHPRRILFENVAVSSSRDDSLFAAPPAAAPTSSP